MLEERRAGCRIGIWSFTRIDHLFSPTANYLWTTTINEAMRSIMASLTSFLPTIAPAFRLTTAAMYERQRALVRMGLLPTPQGRGRGSGAEATPETVALLIIACLATDNLSDTDGRVQTLAAASFVDGKYDRCRWTGAENFKEALVFLLSAQAPSGLGAHTSITVSRAEPNAGIFFQWKKRPGKGHSQFGPREPILEFRPVIVTSELPSSTLHFIQNALRTASAIQSAEEQSS
ncbi:hypothetical protein V1282_005377 [Nitrobacteraceae bacterium AZCC 2146]